MGLFCGIMYGGFVESKKAYTNFMDRNQATAFESHVEAKKKLQESMVLSFGRGGWKLGWRIGVFATTYVAIATSISVYRNKYTIFDYIAGGAITGALYKWKLGPRGMIAGFVVGMCLGTLAGSGTILLLKLTGTSMEEIRYWQYKWKTERSNVYKEGYEKSIKGTELGLKDIYQELHDERLKIIKGLETLDEKKPASEAPSSETQKAKS
jgi:complex I assembly factor TIMMDC1